MEIAKDKSKAALFALFLIFAMAVSIVALPAAQETLGKKQNVQTIFLLLFSWVAWAWRRVERSGRKNATAAVLLHEGAFHLFK